MIIIRWLHRLEDALLVFLVLAMLALALTQIILRNGFDSGLIWGDSLLRVLVLWITLFGAMVASRSGRHIGIDLATRYFSPHMARFSAVITRLVTAMICGWMAWQSYRFVQLELEFPMTAFAAVPTWICETILPFGFGIIGLRYLLLALGLGETDSEHDA